MGKGVVKNNLYQGMKKKLLPAGAIKKSSN
jgi:hypothetical protein